MRLRATMPASPDKPIKGGLAEWLGVLVVGSYFLELLICVRLKAELKKIFRRRHEFV